MVNYLDAMSIYSWKMTDEHVSKLEDKLGKLDWKVLLFIQVIVAVILSVSSFVLISNLVGFVEKDALLIFMSAFFSSFLLGVLFLFGGDYFTKLFFKTDLSVTQFYTVLMYLYLPILMMYGLITVLFAAVSIFIPMATVFVTFLYIVTMERLNGI